MKTARVLFAGAALIVVRRAAGVLLLGGGGLAILVHTAASFRFVSAAEVGVVGYYAMFWLPAGVLGLIAAVLALRRTC